MSYMFEVYYKPPADPKKEAVLTEVVSRLGGWLSYREGPDGRGSICLTYEFDGLAEAEAAGDALRKQGEHVEGPVEYGL
jgi:hypothetical protein